MMRYIRTLLRQAVFPPMAMVFMMWPIQDLARVFAELQRAIASAERIFALIDTAPEIHDKPTAISA